MVVTSAFLRTQMLYCSVTMTSQRGLQMVLEAKVSLPRCARCNGRLFLVPGSVDRECFTCGNVVYGVEPMDREGKETRPTRGGKDLR